MFNERKTGRKKGFTLLELLVVIAIIGLLAAILLPALMRARAHARYGRWLAGVRASNMIDPNCVLYFTFERDTIDGGTMRNLAEGFDGGARHGTRDLDGTIVGAAEAPGRFPGKTALSFDGGDWVEVPHSASLDITEAVTMEAWVKINRYPTTWNLIVTKGSVGTTRAYGMWIHNAGNILLSYHCGVSWWHYWPSGQGFTTGNWHHVVGVIDTVNDQRSIYIDSVRVAHSTLAIPAMSTNDLPLFIGSRLGTWPIDGIIDEVAIFNRALSEDEIRARFEGGRP